MWLHHSSSLFVFWIPFCFLSSFATCTQIDDYSTSSSDGEEEYKDEDLDGLGRVLLIIFAVFVAGVFLALVSIVFIIAGLVVSWQWPDPKCCCWSRPMSDTCCGGCCCSLYYTNISLGVIWLATFAFTLYNHVLALLAIPAGLFILHVLAARALYRQFQKSGWPNHQIETADSVQEAAMVQL